MAQSLTIQRLFEPADETVEFAAQSNSPSRLPTAEAYGEWHRAFRFFNQHLFDNAAPDCLITFTRRVDVLGYFCSEAFSNGEGTAAHEISMNPMWFSALGDRQSYATLVHEMCHLLRHIRGDANRKGGKGARGYHDAVWANFMEKVGLMPSATGAPGGKRTGFRVGHYIVEDGPFDLACREFLAAGNAINWRDDRLLEAAIAIDPDADGASAGRRRRDTTKNTRTGFICAGCDLKAWARASARLSCLACNQPLLVR